MKGAEETLHQKSGNDCDQATLLAALLRASGYPTGMSGGAWSSSQAGTTSPSTGSRTSSASTTLRTSPGSSRRRAIPYKPVIAGGGISNFHIEHIWVESQIPYANYRGAIIDSLGKTWLGLDTSIKVKGYQQNQPKDVYELSAVSGQLGAVRDEYLD